MNKRFNFLKKKLIDNKCFKVICGAGNEDKDEVKKIFFYLFIKWGNTI